MEQNKIQFYFFISLTLLLLIFSLIIFRSYWVVIFLSILFSVIFYPLYEKFVYKLKGRKSISAGLTLIAIVFVIILPTIFISATIFNQAVDLYNSILLGGGAEKIIGTLNGGFKNISTNFFPPGTYFSLEIGDYVEGILKWIINNFSKVFIFVFEGFLGSILMLITIYYLLVNGEKIKNNIIKWSPLPNNYDGEIINNLKNSIDALVRGRFLVAIAQGLFMGFGFFIFDLPNPVLWGFVGGIVSLIPILGTSVLTIPTSLYMFLTGNFFGGIGILIWGALAVGFVDDILGFFIIKRSIKIHPLFVLFSVLGGVELFGLVGFLVGPVIVSSLLSFLRIYPLLFGVSREHSRDKLEEQVL